MSPLRLSLQGVSVEASVWMGACGDGVAGRGERQYSLQSSCPDRNRLRQASRAPVGLGGSVIGWLKLCALYTRFFLLFGNFEGCCAVCARACVNGILTASKKDHTKCAQKPPPQSHSSAVAVAIDRQ